MFRGDDGPLGAAGLNELPPYYSKRLQVAVPTGQESVRGERRSPDADAQAERLFRDFKMGLLTLVVVALLLLAYFWDGDRSSSTPGLGEREDVLSFSMRCPKRAEVMPSMPLNAMRPTQNVAAPRQRASEVAFTPAEERRQRAAQPAAVETIVYTVRPGDTLSGIALRFYGSASHWKAILVANRSRLRRPADLRPGMKLVVPVRSRTASASEQPSHYLARAGPPQRR
jgi:hypothetical protein